ncbi:MAG: hypothetical protein SCK29_06305 [Bacillota bacterium]|nr:hypothetical protein [Bacillota bacterium]MDW7683720.1 hypothetical protein [Bacillota bacterium]
MQYADEQVPEGLKRWFVIHFIVDVLTAVPLFLFPYTILEVLGWPQTDPVMTRLFAAALFAIGIESFLGRNAGVEAFKGMLNLKLIWSSFAAGGILISLLQNPEYSTMLSWAGVTIFLLFNAVWCYWRIVLEQKTEK